MAWTFSHTAAPTGSTSIFAIVTRLLALGWTKTQDSDGTTYSSSGTQVTSGGVGANGLANDQAWFVLKYPGANRAFCFQRGVGGNTVWRVSYCANDAFTGGAPAATQIPAPAGSAIEVVLLGGGTPAVPTFDAAFAYVDGAYNFHVIAGGSAEGYSWTALSEQTAAPNFAGGVFGLDAINDPSASDTDPFVPFVSGVSNSSYGGWINTDIYVGSPKTWIGPLDNAVNNVKIGIRTYGFGNTNFGTNPFTGKDNLGPVPWARNTATEIFKGWSTLFQFASKTNRASFFTLNADGGTKNKLYVNNTPLPVVVPWDGTDLGYGSADAETFGNIGVPRTTYYKKRARDSACVPVTYVTWVTTDPAGAFPGVLPCGGPLVEETVVQVWTV